MRTKFPVELLTEIGRESAELLVKDKNFHLQKKLDGHRRQFERLSDGRLVSYNRKGESVSYPNELAGPFDRLKWKTFVIDGELVGDVFYAFDLFERNGVVIAPKAYELRLDELYMELSNLPSGALLRTTPTFLNTRSKTAALAAYYTDRAEGVVFKRIVAPYRAGRCGQHFKFKFTKMASCIVTSVGKNGKASIEIALADLEQRKIVPVGSCSINGKATPTPGSIVEVKYLYATEAMRLYQPVYMRMRPDQVPADCTLEQLQFKEGFALRAPVDQ